MQKSWWMPPTAGTLDIEAGAVGVISAGLLIFVAPEMPSFLGPILPALLAPWAMLGIVAIVGGVFAFRRKIWGLALAGSIAAFFIPWAWLLGIAAIVLTALSKNEFE